jgi:hypothetical protein
MSEMIERVAKAMFRSLDADPRFIGRDDLTPEHPGWRLYCCQAQAAIEAMREPTDAMVAAAHNSDFESWSPEPGEGRDSLDLDVAWRAMIDAALNV